MWLVTKVSEVDVPGGRVAVTYLPSEARKRVVAVCGEGAVVGLGMGVPRPKNLRRGPVD